MRSMKRMLSLLLALCMIFAMMPSFAMAATTPEAVVTFNGTTYSVQENSEGKYIGVYSAGEETLFTVDTKDAAVEAAFGEAMKAWKKAKSGTVTLQQSVTLTKTIDGVSTTTDNPANAPSCKNCIITVSDGESLTLNLNGFNLNLAGGLAMDFLWIHGSGNLTINGSTYSKGDTWNKSNTIVQNADWSVFQSASDFTGTVKFKNVNVDRQDTTQSTIFRTRGSGELHIDGGIWKYGAIYGQDSKTNVNVYLTGGFEIRHTASYALKIQKGTAYISNAVIYTSSSTGFTNKAASGAVYYKSSAADQNESTVEHDTTTTDTYGGKNLYKHTVKPAPVNAVGYTRDGATTEDMYKVDISAANDDTQNKIYTTAEKAFAAAVAQWKTDKAGTIKLYQDLDLSGLTAAAIAMASGESLTLDLGGRKVTNKNGSTVADANFVTITAGKTDTEAVNFTAKDGTVDWYGSKAILYAESPGTSVNVNITLESANMTSRGDVLTMYDVMAGSVTFNGGKYIARQFVSAIRDGDYRASTVAYEIKGDAVLECPQKSAIRIGNQGTCTVYGAVIKVNSTASSTDMNAKECIASLITSSGGTNLNYPAVIADGYEWSHDATAADYSLHSEFSGDNFKVTTQTITKSGGGSLAEYYAPNGDKVLTDGSVADAFAKSQDSDVGGGTVKLLKDVELETFESWLGAGTTSFVQLTGGKAFTLDLAGMTLTLDTAKTEKYSLLLLNGNASATIKNGSIQWGGNAANVIELGDAASGGWTGALTLENVDIANDGSGRIVYANVAANSGSITVNGGALSSRNAPITLASTATAGKQAIDLNLKGGVVLTSHHESEAGTPSIEIVTASLTAGATIEPTIHVADAVFWTPADMNIYTPDVTDQSKTTLKPADGMEILKYNVPEAKTFTYYDETGAAESHTANLYKQVCGKPAVSYTAADGQTQTYSSLADAFTALKNDTTSAEKRGTITMLGDYVIGENEVKMGTAIIENVTGWFIWDLAGYTISTAEGYELDSTLMSNVTGDHTGTIKNGSFDLTTSEAVFMIGDASNDPVSNITFKNVMVYIAGAMFLSGSSNNADITLDGGEYSVVSDSARVFANVNSKTGKVRLKSGVMLKTPGTHKYSFNVSNQKVPQVYFYDASVTSYSGTNFLDNRGTNYEPVALMDADGNVIDTSAKGAVTGKFTKVQIASIFTDLNASGVVYPTYLWTYSSAALGGDQTENSVAKSETTGQYYDVEQLTKYLPMAADGEVFTALKDWDGNQTEYGKDTGKTSAFKFGNAATLNMGSYNVIGDIEAASDLTINGGTITGDVTAKNGLTMTDTVVNGSVTIDEGILTINGGSVKSTDGAALTVNSVSSHCISGTVIETASPMVVGAGAILRLDSSAKVITSGSDVASGSGSLLLKVVDVTFANASEPGFGGVSVEGYCPAENRIVGQDSTTWKYILVGDASAAGNVAMLVENKSYFATVAEAVAAASDLTAETVKLIADSTENAFVLDNAYGINLDLNGYTLKSQVTVSTDASITNGAIASASGDAVTVESGYVYLADVELASTANALCVNGENAVVTVSGGSLTGSTADMSGTYALKVVKASSVALFDAVEILSGASNNAPIFVDETNNGFGIVSMESATVYAPANFYSVNSKWAEGQDKIEFLSVTVGRYPDTWRVENPADGTNETKSLYIVSIYAPAAKIGDTNYATLREAVAASTKGCEIVLLRDVDLDDYNEFGQGAAGTYMMTLSDCTLNLNGKTIRVSDAACLNQNVAFGVSGSVTFKNGTFESTVTNYSHNIRATKNGTSLTLENMIINATKSCISVGSGTSTVHFNLIRSTLTSSTYNAIMFTAKSGAGLMPGRQLTMSGGSRIIGKEGGFNDSENVAYTEPGTFNLNDAYIYVPKALSDLETIPNFKAPVTKDGSYQVYSYFGEKGQDVAQVDSEKFTSVQAALDAAKDDGKTVKLLSDLEVMSALTVHSGVTLDLDGHDLSFGFGGSMTVESGATVDRTGGDIITEGTVTFASGSQITQDGETYPFQENRTIHSDLSVKKVSLSLNDKVDVNLKFIAADVARFVEVSGLDGLECTSTNTNGYAVYKKADLASEEYDDPNWVSISGVIGADTYYGLPKNVNVKTYAKSVIKDPQYGESSSLGKSMASLLKHFGDDLSGIIDGALPYVENASFGVADKTDAAGEITVTGDLSKGYELTFNVKPGTVGTLSVTASDIFGYDCSESFALDGTETAVTYSKLHAADVKQTVTAVLKDANGAAVATLTTSLSALANGDNSNASVIAGNYAEKFFTGK